MRALAAKISYRVDPENPYPKQFTGHMRITLANGEVHEHRQGFFKGGVDHPMSEDELQQKFLANCRYGQLPEAQVQAILAQLKPLFEASKVNLNTLAVA